MSRYTIVLDKHTEVDENGNEYVLKMTFVYGYDKPLQEYFLQLQTIANGRRGEYPIRLSEDTVELVGTMSELLGNKGNFMEVCERVGIWDRIPDGHKDLVVLDLPIDGDGWVTIATLRGDGK